MEERVEEILKLKGLRWADLARTLGLTQSNLMSSLKGNPKLSRLQEVAKALGVSVADLFAEVKPSLSVGTLNLDNKVYALVPMDMPSKPEYQYDDDTIGPAIKGFLKRCVTEILSAPLSLVGLYMENYPIALVYEPTTDSLYVSLWEDKDSQDTWKYERLPEYLHGSKLGDAALDAMIMMTVNGITNRFRSALTKSDNEQ